VRVVVIVRRARVARSRGVAIKDSLARLTVCRISRWLKVRQSSLYLVTAFPLIIMLVTHAHSGGGSGSFTCSSSRCEAACGSTRVSRSAVTVRLPGHPGQDGHAWYGRCCGSTHGNGNAPSGAAAAAGETRCTGETYIPSLDNVTNVLIELWQG